MNVQVPITVEGEVPARIQSFSELSDVVIVDTGSSPAAVEALGALVGSFFDVTGCGSMLGVDLVDFGSVEAQAALARLEGPLSGRVLRVCLGAAAQTHDDGVERFVMLRAVPRGKTQNIILEVVRGRAAMERRAIKSRAIGRPLVVRLAPGSST